MEALIIAGLVLVVIVMANKQPSPAAVAPAAATQPPRQVEVNAQVHAVIPSIAPATQVNEPIPITILQNQNAPSSIPFQPGVIVPPQQGILTDVVPGAISAPLLPNPDIGTFGNFGPPPPVPGQELQPGIVLPVQTAPVPVVIQDSYSPGFEGYNITPDPGGVDVLQGTTPQGAQIFRRPNGDTYTAWPM